MTLRSCAALCLAAQSCAGTLIVVRAAAIEAEVRFMRQRTSRLGSPLRLAAAPPHGRRRSPRAGAARGLAALHIRLTHSSPRPSASSVACACLLPNMAAGLKSECCWLECASQESDQDEARLPGGAGHLIDDGAAPPPQELPLDPSSGRSAALGIQAHPARSYARAHRT